MGTISCQALCRGRKSKTGMKNMEMAEWVIVVDDNIADLKLAGHVLSENGMRVTALNSGQALLNYLVQEKQPDMLLLDIRMPDMDGFELLKRIRKMEEENGKEHIPVVFLSADDRLETEREGLALGAVDYIRKPYEPEILVQRLKNILNNSKRIIALSEEASTDKLTGLLNKVSVNQRLERACREYRGALLIIDLDYFKLVNDLYGHEAGDKILSVFSNILKKQFRSHDIVGRIGGDEFIAFLRNLCDAEAVKKIVQRLGEQLGNEAQQILGTDMTIPLGVSVGAVLTEGNADFMTLFGKADKALYTVKQNGRHDCAVYDEADRSQPTEEKSEASLDRMDMVLSERYVAKHAMWLGQEAFANIYRYMYRYIQRYHEKAYKILYTVTPKTDMTETDFAVRMGKLGESIKTTLRNSDIMMQNVSNQFFLFLPMVSEEDIQKVIDRIQNAWTQNGYDSDLVIVYEAEAIVPEEAKKDQDTDQNLPWIVVVDADIAVLKTAGNVLSENGMRVTVLNSGQALLNYIESGNDPDLILMDVMLPGMDGFETMKRLQNGGNANGDFSVIFLSDSDDEAAEERGLSMGALDFIKKPFAPNVLSIRVRRALEAITLRGSGKQ
ncbi:MAG: response regulator [Lachnospiraceae bacterium]|nr:response regulator [Lachnospiraceae bacterium]